MRTALVLVLLLAFVLAGCAQKKDDGTDDGSGTGTSTGTATGSSTGKTTGKASGTGSSTGTGTTAPAGPRTANLTADVTAGEAPLAVNFTLTSSAGASDWRLSFGDGDHANGTGQPSASNHTYAIGGNFSAILTVAFPDGSNATANATITVTVPAGSGAPDVTHFEFADSLGCAGDLPQHGPDQCITFQMGPDGDGIDGYWQALDLRYWGLSFTSTVTQGGPVPAGPLGSALNDSDCVFTDAAFAIIGEANNGGNPCTGTVPDGTAFIFIYPYASPALEMTIDFTV